MKGRPASDPTSWRYQANIHGTTDSPPQPLWSQCEHGTQFFFSWHRMYLYYFERILRKASGSTKLALPYWNYSDAPANRVLPLPFRDPADATNPLFVSGRFINNGSSLSASAVNYAAAFGELDFFDFSDAIEGTPHAAVHVQTGGLMGSVPTAANDPIFWLHHANIDRLWEGWLGWGGGRHNPDEPHPWLNQTYTFFDENGNQVSLTGRQILNTRRRLRYRYDKLPPSPMAAAARAARAQVTQTPQRKEQLLARADGVTLGAVPSTVVMKSEAATPAELNRILGGAADSRAIHLVFRGIEYEPGSYYEIYVNLPGDPVNAQVDDPHFAGVIAPFIDPKHKDHIVRVNVRPTLERLRAQGLLQGSDIALAFVPKGPLPPEGKPAPQLKARMTVGQISLVAR
jgi:hypothetical protein